MLVDIRHYPNGTDKETELMSINPDAIEYIKNYSDNEVVIGMSGGVNFVVPNDELAELPSLSEKKVKEEPKPARDIERCGSCGYKGKKVECGGIYHCPNPACRVCGASWFKYKLTSFKETDGNSYTFNPIELVAESLKHVDDSDDQQLRKVTFKSCIKWLEGELKEL